MVDGLAPARAGRYICIMTQTCNKLRPRTPREAARRKDELDRLLDAELFRAMGDPTRLRLLSCLARCGRRCLVGELAECCSVDLSVVSRHLALLARAGVLETTREGRTVRYQVRYAQLCNRLRGVASALAACCPDSMVEAPDDGRGGACCGNRGQSREETVTRKAVDTRRPDRKGRPAGR